MKKIFKYVLLVLLGLAILFFNPSVVKAAEPASTVSINGETLTDEYKYLVNGVKAKNGTLGSDGCTAQFDSDRGILTLSGYTGKGISTGKGENLTIKLIGNNTITCNGTAQAYGIYHGSDGTLKITSDSEATLTINLRSIESIAIGIRSDESNIYSNDNIIIGGKANIIVNATSSKNVASGIQANSPVSIIEKASFNATIICYKNARSSNHVMQSGFDITKPLTINTTGDINLDVSNKPGSSNWSSYIYGIYSTSTMLLQNVGTMTIKYPYYPSGKTSDVVGAWNASWTISENFAVNEGIVDGSNTKEIHSGSGIVHTLTLESAKNKFGKSTGQYFNGDTIDIWAISDVSGLNFKNWSYSAGLVKNSLSENTTYTMPNSNATVTANYSPFVSQPKFTKINSSSGNIDYTLNEGFTESGRRLVKSGESAEDTFSSYHNILSTPYKIEKGTENHQVPAGKYKIAVKNESKWYYSDIFTVNYDEQISDDNTEDNANDNTEDNTNNNTENNIENNTGNNTGNKIENNTGNNTQLPQTGEENNAFTKWLSIAIALGIFWISSMFWIEHERKKMIKK